jgi:hypothetical protein
MTRRLIVAMLDDRVEFDDRVEYGLVLYGR